MRSKVTIYETVPGGIGLVETAYQNFDFKEFQESGYSSSIISEFENFLLSCDFSNAGHFLYNWSIKQSLHALTSLEKSQVKLEIRKQIISAKSKNTVELEERILDTFMPYIDMLIEQGAHLAYKLIHEVRQFKYEEIPVLMLGSKALSFLLAKAKENAELIYQSIFRVPIDESKSSINLSDISRYHVALEDSIYSCVNGCTECIILPTKSCSDGIEQEFTIDRSFVSSLMLSGQNQESTVVQLTPDTTPEECITILEKNNLSLLKVNLKEYFQWGHKKISDIQTLIDARNNVSPEFHLIPDPTKILLYIEEKGITPLILYRIRKIPRTS